MKTTITLWSLCWICICAGFYVKAQGGWGRVRSPFPLELSKTVYRTNYVEVEVPKMILRYVDVPTPAVAKLDPFYGVVTNDFLRGAITNDFVYVTNLFWTNISINYVTNR